MNLYKSIKSFLLKKSTNEKIEAPEGLCPACWGRQEYGGKFFEAIKKEKIDVTKIDAKKGWIQDYAEKNLSDIILHKKGHSLTCSVCYRSNDQSH